MNNIALDKMIKRMILPKYPWITDYEIFVQDEGEWTVNSKIYYRVDYFVTPEWRKGDNEELLKDMKNVQDMTKNLFKILGFDDNHKFEGSEFYLNNQS